MKRTRQGQPPCETPESNPHFHSPQMEAMGLLLLVTRLHHSEIERRIASLGIHHSQNRMLLRLSCGDGTNSQRELADAMNISHAQDAGTGGLYHPRYGRRGQPPQHRAHHRGGTP